MDYFQIPIYVLTNTFDRIIPSGKLMYLEGNKLLCDCNSVKVLRVKTESVVFGIVIIILFFFFFTVVAIRKTT